MAEMNRQAIGTLFRAFGDILIEMDDREFEMLSQGKATLRVVIVKNEDTAVVAKRVPKTTKNRIDDSDSNAAAEVAQRLKDAESRENGEAVLSSIKHRSRKKFLTLVARKLDVRVESRDTIAEIERKLFDSTVGGKLQARAFAEVPFTTRSPSSLNKHSG